MDNKSYLETYNEEHSSVIESLKLNKRIFIRLLGFLICSVIYFLIYVISKTIITHDIQTQFLNTFVNSIMIFSYVVAFLFLIGYLFTRFNKDFYEKLDKVKFQTKRIFFLILDWLVILPACATVASFCFAFLFTFAVVDGESMYPTVLNESTVFVSYLEEVERFDVVVVYITDSDNLVSDNYTEYYIKRVIGLPGDTITWVKGVLTINGNVIDETYFDEVTKLKFKQFWDSGYEFEGKFSYKVDGEVHTSYVIPEGYYFVMGDNRTGSNDSRQIGLIPYYNIEGVVLFEMNTSGIERVE